MKTILIVDDSSFVRKFHSNLIKSGGFMSDTAVDGVDALEKSLRSDYDAVLCDINMPNMDGIEYTRRLREVDEDTPIIIISTQAERHQKDRAFDAGANLYLVKPVKPNNLLLNIKMLIGGS